MVVVVCKNLLAPVVVVERYDVTWIATLLQAISAVNLKVTYPATVLTTSYGVVILFKPSPT